MGPGHALVALEVEIMVLPRDRFEYSASVDRPQLKLPGDARVVVWTIVNVEEWDIQEPMPRGVLPAPGGATPIPDVPNWAWHEYGMRVGFRRLKAALDKHDVKATASINASVCLSYPRVAEAIRDGGWEFMGHGFTQKALNLVNNEQAMIRQSIDTIRDFTGKPPRGWLGPGLTETWDTLEILAAEGIEYRRPLRAGLGVEIAHGRIRERVPRLDGDRVLGPDLEALTVLVQSGTFAGIAQELES